MNPYRMVGQVAEGGRFVDRPELVRSICTGWQEPGRPSNLCVLGSHRTGKTSVVKHALALVDRQDLVVVWLSVGRFSSGFDLFRAIVKDVLDEIGDHASLEAIAEVAFTTESWYDLDNAVTAFFKEVRKAGRTVLIVLDEFDRASVICTRLAEFQLLRDLASEPQFPVGLVTISRRPIKDIEIDAAGGSILDGVVTIRRYVGMFTAAQGDAMLARAGLAGIDLTPVREQIMDRSGLHPFLLESLCNGIVEHHQETGDLAVDLAYDRVLGAFHTQFEHLVQNVRVDTSSRGLALLRLLAQGGASYEPSLDLNRFLQTGLVSRSADQLVLFSPEFARYLLMLEA
jgi:hypothetical protein